MVMSSTSSSGIGRFKFDEKDSALKHIIWRIDKNQRNRWKKRRLIPLQILDILWSWGIEIGDEPPERGMSLGRFLDLLWEFFLVCPEKKTRDAALTLYVDTVRSEIMSFGRGRKR